MQFLRYGNISNRNIDIVNALVLPLKKYAPSHKSPLLHANCHVVFKILHKACFAIWQKSAISHLRFQLGAYYKAILMTR